MNLKNKNNKSFDELDFDNDGLQNWEEFNRGTNIYSKDTDGNGISDINEINNIKKEVLKKYPKAICIHNLNNNTYSILSTNTKILSRNLSDGVKTEKQAWFKALNSINQKKIKSKKI